jgi:hypothetical protein
VAPCHRSRRPAGDRWRAGCAADLPLSSTTRPGFDSERRVHATRWRCWGCSACLRPAVSCPCARWWASTTSPASLRSAVRAGQVMPRRRSGAERTASRLDRRPAAVISPATASGTEAPSHRAQGRWEPTAANRHNTATDRCRVRLWKRCASLQGRRRRRAASARQQNAGVLRWRGVTVSLCPCAPTGTGRACCPRVAAPPLTPRRPRRGAPHDRRDRSTVRCPMT